MKSNEIVVTDSSYEKYDDAEGLLSTRGANDFNDNSLKPGDEVTFPEDTIETYKQKVRNKPNKADIKASEEAIEKLRKHESGEEPLSEEDLKKYTEMQDPEHCIPKATLIKCFDPKTNKPVMLYANYLLRFGKKTPAQDKMTPVDHLTASTTGNVWERANALKGKTIKVRDEKETWWMLDFNQVLREKSIVVIDVQD